MILFVDTATTGLWNWKADNLDPAQPHLLRLAVLRQGDNGERANYCCLVKPPDGVEIEEGATQIHKITRAMAATARADASEALDVIMLALQSDNRIIAHNADYHRKVLESSLTRAGLPIPPDWKPRWYCTMRHSADIVRVRLQGNGQWKWPTMAEAHQHFAGPGDWAETDDAWLAGTSYVAAVKRIYDGIQGSTGRAA